MSGRIAALLGVVALFATGACSDEAKYHQAILDDLGDGKAIGGSLHAARPQLACLDPLDAARGAVTAENAASGTQVGIVVALVRDGRCIYTTNSDGFDMTADGQEHFVTPHGTVNLYAASET